MGGLMEGHCGKEAWVRAKWNFKWTGLDDPSAINFLQPTQMQSSSSKAATTHLKCTERMCLEEACRFKTGEDLDDLCARLKTHFKKHGLDTIAHRNNPND